MFSCLDVAPTDIDITLISPPQSYNIEDTDAEIEAEEGSEEDKMTTSEAQETIMNHSLPKTTSRKNVQLPVYVPDGRLFRAFASRGEGTTQATYRYPRVAKAIHHLASLRNGEAKSEGYLSAQRIEPRCCRCIKIRITTAPHGS